MIARKYQYYQKLNNVVSITKSCYHYQLQFNVSHNIISQSSQFSILKSSQSCYLQYVRILPIQLCDLKEKKPQKRPQRDSHREAKQFSRRHAFAFTSNYIDKRPSSFLDQTRLLLLQMSRLNRIQQVNFQYFQSISFSICSKVYMIVHLIRFIKM